ncbi:MAG: CIA30 family protein [Elainellaceae cyanobacterium]
MSQLLRWDLCRFVKTLAYFGIVPMLGTGWLQQRLDIPAPPSNEELQAMTMGQTILTIAEQPMAAPLAQALAEQGYQAAFLPLNEIPQAIARLQEGVRQRLGGIVCVLPAGGISEDRQAAIATLRPEVIQRRVLFDFRQLTNLAPLWGPVDDVVMGGVSQSDIERVATGALFLGTVSTDNSGGFASVRTRNLDPLDLSSYDGIQLRVRGDGNRYKFLLRDSDRWDGVAYSASFDTVPNDWMTVQIPFDELVPVFRARTLDDDDGINRQSVRAFQIMLSKFEYDGELNPTFEPGEFELVIESIEAYGGAAGVVWLVPGPEPQLELDPSDTVIRTAALGESDSSLLSLTAFGEPRGTLSSAIAAELCVRAMETPALQNRTVVVQAGAGQPLENWQNILAKL